MPERFTDEAREVMRLADREARRFRHPWIGTEHILLGLTREGSGLGAKVLKNLKIDDGVVRREVERPLGEGPKPVTQRKLPQTPRAKLAIEYAMEEVRRFDHNNIGTDHILLGLLWEQEGIAAQVLSDMLGLKIKDVREEVLRLHPHGTESSEAGDGLLSSPNDGRIAYRLARWFETFIARRP